MEGVNVGGEKTTIHFIVGPPLGQVYSKDQQPLSQISLFPPYTFLLDMFLFPIVQECTINAKRPKV
jgi:hypothetical protein